MSGRGKGLTRGDLGEAGMFHSLLQRQGSLSNFIMVINVMINLYFGNCSVQNKFVVDIVLLYEGN